MRSLVSGALLMLLLGLSACTTPEAPETETPTPTVSSTPKPAPTRTPEPAAQAFGGDCGEMLTETQVGALFGAPAALADGWWSKDYPPSLLLGSLTCGWESEEGELVVTAIPRDAVPQAVVESRATASCKPGEWFCGASVTAGDLWMVLGLEGMGEDPEWEPIAEGAVALLREAAREHQDARVAERADDWWIIPTCEEFDAVLDAGNVMESADVRPDYPSDNTPMGDEWDSLVYSGLDGWCPWTDYAADRGRTLQLQVWPGAADAAARWIDDPAAEPATIAGADRAVSVLHGDGERVDIYVVSGANVLWVYGDVADREALERLAAAALAHLDS